MNTVIEDAPARLKAAHTFLFTNEAQTFLERLLDEFESAYDAQIIERQARAVAIKRGDFVPQFNNRNNKVDWTIAPLPERLKNRKLDLGDCSPANSANLIDALNANVQGIQVDFDDGHCPTWHNQIQGLYNVSLAVRSRLNGMLYGIDESPILMLRPRAFNMIEHHCMVRGRKVPGALFDFALLMYHNGKLMEQQAIGPYFYLSKIESVEEAKLWNQIFTWTEQQLAIPHGTIKACILIENILAAYVMDDILYAIKDHAIGLNCGIWDYSASIIAKFGNSREYLIPDRNKYVNVEQIFLKSYIKLVINTCHRHKAIATGGMAAKILPEQDTGAEALEIIESVKTSKRAEIELGADGFMVYDLRLVPHINKLWNDLSPFPNQLHILPDISDIQPGTLLQIPKGGVTMEGLRHNITVALLFIYHWFCGYGIFYYKLSVEDSATAEISRSQLWQWIRLAAPIEDDSNNSTVTRLLVYTELDRISNQLMKQLCSNGADRKRLISAKYFLLDLVSARSPPEFLTTYLNDSHKFQALHNKADGLVAKL